MIAAEVRDGLRLPVDALRLLGKRWPEVLAWILLGYVVHEFLIRAAAWVAQGNLHGAVTGHRPVPASIADQLGRVFGLGMLGLTALATLVVTVGVFFAMRRDLPLGRPRVAADEARGVRFHDVLTLTLAPFLAFYAAWGLLDQDEAYYVWLGKSRFADLSATAIPGFGWWVLGTAVAAFFAKAVCRQLARAPHWRWMAIVESLLEATYLFLTVFAIASVAGAVAFWVRTRAAWQWLSDAYHWGLSMLPDLVAAKVPYLVDMVATVAVWTSVQLKDAVLQPLVWLAITLIVYRRVGRPGGATGDRRMNNAVMRVAARGIEEKYVAFAQAVRAALVAGLVPFLFFCVWYLAAGAVVGWAWIGVTRYLIGPQPVDFWLAGHDWLRLAEGVFTDVLRLPLLAAAFAMVARRIRAKATMPAAMG